METTLIQIQNMYSSFGRGERKLADWLLQHPSELIGLSISELAAACGCGDATVIRFSKKLGLSGYQALKVSIARELGGSFIGNTATTESDSALELYQKHCSDIMLTLERTRNRLSGNTLEAVAGALLKARTISVFGLGCSASIALDATHKLVRLGLSACAYSDSHMQMIIASHLTAEDVVLAISHSGSSVDIVNSLAEAKKNGATTICITGYAKSPAGKYSDYCLLTNAEETKHSILAMTSRIAQLTIIDTLYIYLVLHGDDKIRNAINSTEEALETKKF